MLTSGSRPTMGSALLDLAWRTGLRLAYPAARLWWRLSQAQHEGALVAVYVGPALLLLRSSYRREWQFPGGGVRRDEAPEAAAQRELFEEIGLMAPVLLPAGVVSGVWDGVHNRVHFFELRLAAPPQLKLDNREIVAARLTPPGELSRLTFTGPVAAYLGRSAGRLPGA
jgi:8-oxo-dGTP diphosphatase